MKQDTKYEIRDTGLLKGAKMKHAAKTTRKFPWALMSLCSYALVLLCSSACVQARVLPDTAKLIPPETVLLVDIDNFSRMKAQFEKTNLYKLYKDPAMTAFIDDVKTKWREKTQKLDENDIFKTIIDADVLPQGRAAVALVLNDQTKDANEPPILFITQWGENVTKIKEAVDKMAKKAVENGAHRKTEDYRGVSITAIIQQSSQPLNYCFIDDCLIGSMNLDVLKFVIAHIKGASSPTLADDADYTATKAVGSYHDIDFYVNIKQIIKTIIAEDTTGRAQTTITNLGFDNVASFGISLGLGRAPGNSSCCKAFLKINGAKKGICKMLEVEAGVLRAPRFIPASAYSATFLNLNIKKAYNELYNVLYSFNPTTAAKMNSPLLPAGPEGEPGLQLKSDIIDYLGSKIVIAQSVNKPFSSTSTPTETLFAVVVSNRSALEKSLSLLHSKVIAPDNPDARRELLGHTIYLVSLPGLPLLKPGITPMQAPTVPPQTPTLAFTITDTHLVFASESTVERAIRALSSAEAVSVGSAKWFTSAKSAIPSIVGLANLEDNSASGEIFWWLMKQGGKAEASGISMGPSPQLVFSQRGFDLFNFSLLPEFDTVRKYFGLSAFYGISRPDGFFFEFKELGPPATD